MFGYLRVKSCGLEETDRRLYRAHFCSVCHQLSRNAGWDASLLTNYDVTLWNLIASGVSAECYRLEAQRKPCTAVPFRRVWVQPLTAEVGATLSAITVLLVGAKLHDAVQDGGRVLPRLGSAWLGSKERKAMAVLQKQGYPVETLLEIPRLQALAEADPGSGFRELVRPTERALEAGFIWIAELSHRPDLKPELGRLGSAIATYIYLWDALEDLEKDRLSGDFNAIASVWGGTPDWPEYKALLEDCLARAEAIVRGLPLGDRRPVCLQLVQTLQQKVAAHTRLRDVCRAPRSPRFRLARAGFVWAQCDCDGCDCCDCNCCDGGGDGCHCIECSCCDCKPGDSCCECNCEKCCCSGHGGPQVDCCPCDCCSCGNDNSGQWLDCSCCCWDDDSNGKKSRHDHGITDSAEPATPARKLLLCPGCRRDLGLQKKSGYQVHACEGCEAFWLDRESQQEALAKGAEQLYLDALKQESKAPIKRGQRMCPACQGLLRSPADPAEPESCGTCGGVLYCS